MRKLFRYLTFCVVIGSCASINTAPPTEIEGTWLGACGGTTRESATFSGDVAYFAVTTYNAASCSSAKWIYVKTSTFKIGDYVARAGERKYDFTQTALTLTPKSSAGVSEMNTSSLCGYNDWALDISRDVTGKNCSSVVQPSNNTKTYSIYKLNTAASPHEIQLGTTGAIANGTSEATRHSTVGSALVKQ